MGLLMGALIAKHVVDDDGNGRRCPCVGHKDELERLIRQLSKLAVVGNTLCGGFGRTDHMQPFFFGSLNAIRCFEGYTEMMILTLVCNLNFPAFNLFRVPFKHMQRPKA